MADIVECPVCFEEFKEPKLLPCNHTLCMKCLEALGTGKTITCPLCNAQHEVPNRGVKAFTENQHVVQLVAERQVRSFIFFCSIDLISIVYCLIFTWIFRERTHFTNKLFVRRATYATCF